MNSLIEIQEMLLKEMRRLDDDDYMKENGKEEIGRSNALSNSSESFLKAVLTNIRILEIANRNNEALVGVQNVLGLTNSNEK